MTNNPSNILLSLYYAIFFILIPSVLIDIQQIMNSDEERHYDEVSFYQNEDLKDTAVVHSHQTEIIIGIQKRQTRGSGLKKHTSFFIKGCDRKGEVSVWRRFNEFNEMRQAMVKVWPGCLIPSLPSKNPLLKNEEEINRKRQRYLDDFLKKMAQRDFLYYSDEFQTFLRSQTINVSQLFQKWAVPTPLSIINRYKSTFSALDGKEITANTVSQIFNFSKLLENNQEKLISYRKIAKQLAFQRDKYNLFYCKYLAVIRSYQTNILPQYLAPGSSGLIYVPNQTTQGFTEQFATMQDLTMRNSYWLLYDLIKNEQRDGRVFIELLQSIEYYGDKARNYQEKIESNIKGIGEAASGKKNLKTLMAKGTNEEIKYQLQVQNEELKKEKEQSQMLRDIVTALVAFVEISQYKTSKKEFYMSTLSKLSKLQSNFADGLTTIWNEILAGLQNVAESYSQ